MAPCRSLHCVCKWLKSALSPLLYWMWDYVYHNAKLRLNFGLFNIIF